MIGLPTEFLCDSDPNSRGGGVIQGSASDCVLICLLAARYAAIKDLKNKEPFEEEGHLLSKLIGYCSKEAHSCVEKAARIGFVKLRILEPDSKFSLRGETLKSAIEEDIKSGLVPFFVSTTLGTTSCCSFDNIHEIGLICRQKAIWLHVDAAYAGNSFICPEFQYLLKGIEFASSFNMNPNKWMLVNFDCSLLWVKDRFKLTEALVVDPLYLQHSYSEKAIDYRHWGIPLSRRFRSLKLWFVIRNYGIDGLQNYIREHCRLAKLFAELVQKDTRFEIVNEVIMGLVCFRLKGSNSINERLLSLLNASGKLHMVPASLNDRFVIRFCVCAQKATEADIKYAYDVLSQFASDLITILQMEVAQKRRIARMSTSTSIANDASLADTSSIAISNSVPAPAYGACAAEVMATATIGNDLQLPDKRHEPQITFAVQTNELKLNESAQRISVLTGRSRDSDQAAASDDSSVRITSESDLTEEDVERSGDLQELSKEEEDSLDEVVMLDRKKKKSLRYKRSFFVRMVSDPKLYNPKIVRALSSTGQAPSAHSRQTSNDSDTGLVTPL